MTHGMDAFPFTEAEWDRVSNASRVVLNAMLADDDVVEIRPVISGGAA